MGSLRIAACLGALALWPALAMAVAADAPATAATVVSVNPAVSRARPGMAPKAVSLGMQLLQGDSLRSDSHGDLRLVLADGSVFSVLPNSEVTFAKLGPQGAGGSVFRLLKGILQASVKRLKGQERQMVVTANGVAGVKGTEYQVTAEGGRTELKVLSGVVELKDPAGKGSISVPAGHAAESYADHVGALRVMDRDEVAALRKSFLAQVEGAKAGYLQKVRGIKQKSGTGN